MTALNLFADQATQIQAIMEATGVQEVAPLVRELLDEALAARRRKTVHLGAVDQPATTRETPETVELIQTLLVRLISQGETTYRIQSASLELLQEALVEARAGRNGLWEALVVPALEVQGRSAEQISSLFDLQTDGAKTYAYGLAEEIKNELDATVMLPPRHMDDDEDRQGLLVYDRADGSLDSTRHEI